jgi:hypothetical protein
MLLGLACVALAHEPVLLPLTQEAWVDESPVAATLSGGAAFSDGTSGTGALGVEANIAERASIALEAGVDSRVDQPLLGGSASVNVLSGAAGDLGFTARYKRQGWEGNAGEIEALVGVSRDFGKTTALANAVFGADIGAPEKDGELAAAALTRLSDALSLGGDARARIALGNPEEEEEAGEEELSAEGEPKYEIVAGPVANLRGGPVTAMLQVGGQVLGLRDGAEAGFIASAGARFGF